MRQLIALLIFILAVNLFISAYDLMWRADKIELFFELPQLRMFGGVMAWLVAGIIYQD